MRRSFATHFPPPRQLLAGALVLWLCGWSPLPAADVRALADLSIEQLLELKVTSVARREQKLSESPAAVFVITQEDIRRSGATSIPEALRLAPGLDVARVDSHTWAISARGFNDVFANKLLVLIDGRSVYTPLYSGVYWDIQDTLIEDIDRIEVIRGPGAALWGANAVNGVINIITKTAAQTQGTLITAGGGTEERAFTSFRFGGSLGEHVHYRIYGKLFERDDSALAGGGDAYDRWNHGQAGFRIDWTPPGPDRFTLQGDIYSGTRQSVNFRLRSRSPYELYADYTRGTVAGGNVLARWTHEFSDTNQLTLQTYFDRTERGSAVFEEVRNTFDVDLQHRFAVGERQTIIWGGGYRLSEDEVRNSFDISLDPTSRSTNLASAFVQDEIKLVKDRLVLTLGSKLEHNDFTGWEVQPSGRLLWTPGDRHSVWASVSRAVRTPSRAKDDIRLRQEPVIPPGGLFAGFPPFVPPSPGVVTTIRGTRAFESEDLLAYELGYRVQASDRLSFDVALFYNEYRELRSVELETPSIDLTASPAELRLHAANTLKGETYGGEISAAFQAAPWWRLRADYALLQMHLHPMDGGNDLASEQVTERRSPRNQANLRSSMDLPHGFEFDVALRYVDSLPSIEVPRYLALDLRIGWRVTDNVELSVVAQNLLDWRHPEFKPTTISTQVTEVESSIYGKVTIRF